MKDIFITIRLYKSYDDDNDDDDDDDLLASSNSFISNFLSGI